MQLGGAQKAAAVLLAMGSPLATRVLKHLEPNALKQVTRAAAQLGSLPLTNLELLIEEFSQAYSEGPDLRGDVTRATALLSGMPAMEASDIISGALGVANSNVWTALASQPEASLATYLGAERTQIATYILSRIDSAAASKVVMQMPRDQRNRILCGLISPPVVSEAAALVIEKTLREDILTTNASAKANEYRSRVAAIINDLDPADAQEAIEQLAANRPDEAERLKSMLFSFNDIPRLSQRARAVLFDKLPTDLVVLALRGMDSAFCDVALSSMASRARRLVEGELSSGVSVPARDIAKARKEIAKVVLDMARRNEIDLGPSEEEGGGAGGSAQ